MASLRVLHNRSFLANSASGLLTFMGISIVTPLVPLVATTEGLSPSAIGLVVSTQSLAPVLLGLPLGALIDRQNARCSMTLGGLGVAIATSLYLLPTSMVTLVLAQVSCGLLYTILRIASAAQAMVVESVEHQAQQLSLYSLGLGLGVTLGPLIGTTLVGLWGFRLAFIGSILTGLLICGLATQVTHQEVIQEASVSAETLLKQSLDGLRLIRRPRVRVALILTVALFIALSVRNSFYPVYLEKAGMEVNQIGFLISTTSATSLVARLMIPVFNTYWTRIGELILAVVCILCVGVGMVVTPLVSGMLVWFLAAVLWGVGQGVYQPLSLQLLASSTCTDERGASIGLRTMVDRLTLMAAPLVFGVVAQTRNLASVFYVGGIVMAPAILVVLGDLRRPK